MLGKAKGRRRRVRPFRCPRHRWPAAIRATNRMSAARFLALALGLGAAVVAGVAPPPFARADVGQPGGSESHRLVASTLDLVRERGTLRCGANSAMVGLSAATVEGRWEGFDVEYCRAVAAAVLGDAAKIHIIPVNAATRFHALAAGEIDILARNTTWTLDRDAGRGLSFVGVSLHDTMGLMAWSDVPGDSLEALPEGARLCVQSHTTAEKVLRDALTVRGRALALVSYGSVEEIRRAFFQRECDVYAGDRTTALSLARVEAPRPEALRMLSQDLSREPLGPVVREGDPQWFDIARWTLFALIQAEDYGLTRPGLSDQMAGETDPARRRFLGLDPGVGAPLGLDDAWVRRIIAQVGSYGEIFERTLGQGEGGLKMDRGLNALWRDGGLMFAPPFP